MGLGLIRIVLAVAVLITHSAYSTTLPVPGAIAVKLFFIISGYYMAMILCEKYKDHHRLFYKNRFLRLFPLYIVTIAFIIVFGVVTYALRGTSINNSLAIVQGYQSGQLSLSTSLFLAFANFSMLFQDLIFFLAPDAQGNLVWAGFEQMKSVPFYSFLLIPQAWSLSLEVVFYMLAPLVIKNIRAILAWMVVSVACRIAIFIAGYDTEQFNYRFFPSELMFFLIGSLSYHLYQKFRLPLLVRLDRYLVIPIILALALYQAIPPALEVPFRVGLYFSLAVAIPYIFNWSKTNDFDNKVGDLSYPFYILHMFTYEVVLVVAPRVGIQAKGLAFLIVWIASTMALSHAMIRLVQAPVERIRRSALSG